MRDIEQALGTNWLNKIGIAVLVIGIALFLAYKFPTLSNAEKVGLGYIVSLGVLALGIFLERKDVYRIFARALIGGGWALVFFTTYAMYFITYTRVIGTEWIDLVLLFAVAWAMVVHTLHAEPFVSCNCGFGGALCLHGVRISAAKAIRLGRIGGVRQLPNIHQAPRTGVFLRSARNGDGSHRARRHARPRHNGMGRRSGPRLFVCSAGG